MSPNRWQNHVVYRAGEGQIHELYWERGKGWKHSNLSAATNAAPAQSAPYGYHYTHQKSQHILYKGKDNQIHEIYKNPGQVWKHSNISARAGAPLTGSRPFGYTFHIYDSQQVVYRGKDNNIYELYYHPGKGWGQSNLTQRSGAALAEGNPTAYIFGVQNHVIYRGRDDHIHELYFTKGKGWKHSDLSGRIGAPAASSNPLGQEYKMTSSQHVFYVTKDNQVHEMYWKEGKGWRHSSLTARANAAPARGDLSCYVYNNQDHIVYTGTDSDIHELYYTPGKDWRHSSLSSKMNAPGAKPGPVGYAFAVEESQHVMYVGKDGQINELYYRDGKGWKHNNLSRAANAPPSVGAVSGFTFCAD